MMMMMLNGRSELEGKIRSENKTYTLYNLFYSIFDINTLAISNNKSKSKT